MRGEPLFSRRLVQEVIDKGVAALVTDASVDARFAAAESIVLSGTRSLVAAPLLDREGCLGMIALSAKQRVHPFGEEDMELLVAFAGAAALRIRNLALTEETARRRLLDRELDLAHDIQMAMLPRAFPERPGIDVAAVLRPARSVGGDLYDVVAEGSRVWLLVGDVSGKGVGAALFMAVTKTLFRAIAPTASSVAEAMGRVNRELARDNERAMFVTAFAARLDLATGELEYVNAGHNPTYRIEPGRAPAPLGGPVDPALGAVEDHEYREHIVRLRPRRRARAVHGRRRGGAQRERRGVPRAAARVVPRRLPGRPRCRGRAGPRRAASRTSPATRRSTTTSPSSCCGCWGWRDSRRPGSVLK